MDKIDKINDTHDTNFNAVDVKRKLRVMSAKINEIIDIVNEMIDDTEEDNDIDDIIDNPSSLNFK